MPVDLHGSDSSWAAAFAAQALSDLNTRDLLADSGAPKCHRLQFVQMAAEKLCKGFLIQANGLGELTYKHCVVGKHLPIVLRTTLAVRHRSSHALGTYQRHLRRLGGEMDMLSPSCDAEGKRTDNVEYPWANEDARVIAPAQYDFPNLNDQSRGFLEVTN